MSIIDLIEWIVLGHPEGCGRISVTATAIANMVTAYRQNKKKHPLEGTD